MRLMIMQGLSLRLAVVSLLCFCRAATLAAEGDTKTVSQVRGMKSAVVQIGFRSDAQQPPAQPGIPVPRMSLIKRAGTGFFVSKQGYVLTAGHVLRGVEKEADATGAAHVVFTVGILLDPSSVPNVQFHGSSRTVDAVVLGIDDVHDVALLKLSQNPFTGELTTGIVAAGKPLKFIVGVAKLNPELPVESEDLLVSGYPLDIPTYVSQKGMVASESFSIVETQSPSGPPGLALPEKVDSILLDATINPGNSGGPVYDSRSGTVVGICEAYENSPIFTNKGKSVAIGPNNEILTQNAGLAVVIPIKYGIELLKKYGVTDYLATPTRPGQRSP